MSQINRYLIRTILSFTALTGLALVAIFTFISFVAEIDETQRGFTMLQLLWYTLLMLPEGVHTLMPIIALLGTLMGLGALAAQNELTAMRASGVTLLRISAATLIAGALIGSFALLLGDWLAPMATMQARSLKSELRYAAQGGVTEHPLWLRDGSSIVHIRALRDERHVANVDIYTLTDDLAVARVIHAARAEYVGGQWLLSDVEQTEFAEGAVQASRHATLEVSASLSPEVLRLFVLEANSVSAPGLLRLIQYMKHNGLDASQYELSLWRKLVAPLTVMVMMLFAVPFVLGSQRSGGAGQRLLVGILVGLGFYVTNEVSANLGQLYGWSAPLAAALPTALLTLLAVWRMRRAR